MSRARPDTCLTRFKKMFSYNSLKVCVPLIFGLLLFVESKPVQDVKETIDSSGQHWFGPVRRCPLGEDYVVDKCLSKIVRELTPLVGHGIKELGLEALDPILIDKFEYVNKAGPIKFKVVASGMEISDLPRYDNLTFHFDHSRRLMHFVYDAKKIKFDTNYTITGMLFGVMPLKMSGPLQFDVHGIRAEGNMHLYKTLNDNGEVIVQLKDAQIDTLTNEEFKLCRLFENNPVMNAIAQGSFHRFGPMVFRAIEPRVADFTGEIIANRLLNPILQRLPYMADFIK